MSPHRIDVLGAGVAGLVDRVDSRQLDRVGLLIAVAALDTAAVPADGPVAEALKTWRSGRPAAAHQRLEIAALRGRLDTAALAASHAGRDAEYRAVFARARAVAALGFGVGGGGREGLREVACEACAATGSASLVANLLRDHGGD
ncbi:hypothetical protein [Gordonia rubripertincta]|uniref:DUF222 domain-containing protein n=1 Tax=Gordonia rubripertincta TaxID=36822 RepID=A0ABT4MTI6_GORRU|nr:hypothetical protein [Gordonia rubripertincta]MCZ4550326.1 hypothetical protein [Gordonia rubripertincta]